MTVLLRIDAVLASTDRSPENGRPVHRRLAQNRSEREAQRRRPRASVDSGEASIRAGFTPPTSAPPT